MQNSTNDEYEVKIKTGNIKGAGTKSDISLTIIGTGMANSFSVFLNIRL